MIESEITLQLHLEIAIKRKGSVWVAWCRPLDVLSQARTKGEAIDALKEAVDLWFESCIQRGVLDKALAEVGFKPAKDGELIPSDANVVGVTEKKRHVPQPHHAHHQRQVPRYISVSVPAYTAVRSLNAGATC